MKRKFSVKRSYFAFPYALISVLFVVIPLIILFVYAFRDENGNFTLYNFIRIWTEKRTEFFKILGRTSLLALATTVICLLLAYPLALTLCNLGTNKTATLVLLFVLPMWINSLLRIAAVKVLLEDWIQPGFTFTLIGMVYDFFPFMLLPIYTNLANMDPAYLEASQDLGASPLKTFLKVRLPLSLPGIISGIIMVFMPALSTFAISGTLGGGMMLLGNLIEVYMTKSEWYNYGAAYAFILLILIAVCMWVATRLSKTKNTVNAGGSLI